MQQQHGCREQHGARSRCPEGLPRQVGGAAHTVHCGTCNTPRAAPCHYRTAEHKLLPVLAAGELAGLGSPKEGSWFGEGRSFCLGGPPLPFGPALVLLEGRVASANGSPPPHPPAPLLTLKGSEGHLQRRVNSWGQRPALEFGAASAPLPLPHHHSGSGWTDRGGTCGVGRLQEFCQSGPDQSECCLKMELSLSGQKKENVGICFLLEKLGTFPTNLDSSRSFATVTQPSTSFCGPPRRKQLFCSRQPPPQMSGVGVPLPWPHPQDLLSALGPGLPV